MNTPARLRFLFTTFDGGGNVAPIMIAVARLVERGHLVRVMSDRVNRDEADAAGASFVSWTRAPSKATRSRELDPSDWAAATPQQGVQDMVQHFLCGMALAYAQDVIEELEREPADLVVNFDMLLGVMAACEARGQKLGLLSTMTSMFPLPGVPPFGPALAPARTEAERALHAQIARDTEALFDTGLPALNSCRETLGLKPLPHVFDQANAASVRWLGTARAFDFAPEVLPAYLRYAGPLIRDPAWVAPWKSPWPATDRRPLIVVGFSTSFQNHADCLQRIVDACAELEVRVLVTLSGSIFPHEITPAANTEIADTAPHTVVMREASLVITHGGHGTVITALTHGVPMLVIPHGRDQGDNAARVVARGAGLSLPPSASVAELRASVQRLLGEPAFRSAAHTLGEAVAAEARDSTLIDELEALAGSKLEKNRRDVRLHSEPASADRRATLKAIAATTLCAALAVAPRAMRAATSGKVDFTVLRKQIAGEFIPVDAPGYASTRAAMSWNKRMSGRMPDAIVRVRSAADVCMAVRFAAARGLKVAIRGGGHNYFGASIRSGGLLLDLSALNGLKIDAANRRASVQPAVKSGALVSALTPLGLAFPVGHCSDVALSGFLLNGGIGWNAGEWGPSCMSVRGIEMVTASGELVYADANQNSELLWAARGAGPGFFGVITRYDITLRKLPRVMATRSVFFDAASTEDVGDWIAAIAASAPPQVENVSVLYSKMQLSPTVPAKSALSVSMVAFADSESQARGWLAPMASYPARAKVLGSAPYATASFASLQSLNDADFPEGCRFHADHCWSDATPRQFMSAVHSAAVSAVSPRSFVFISPNVVRAGLIPSPADAAFSMHGSIYFGSYAFWAKPQEDLANIDWVRSTLRAVEPLTTGHYVGEADLAIGAQRAARCFSPAAWTKLGALRKKYDPSGLFFGYLEDASEHVQG